MNKISKLLASCCIVILASGCETRSGNGNPKSKQNSGEKKTVLTAEEAASLFANEIGRWKITGKNIPVGGEVEPFDDILETRWRVKGESVEFTVSPLINGKRVPFVTHREYDPQKGVFIWRSKGEGFPETSGQDHYNPATKTYRGKYIHSDGAVETKKCLLVSQDKMLIKSIFELDGKVVFSREMILTRLVNTEESGDLPADKKSDDKTNDMVIGLTKKQAAEIMAWEIGEWSIRGQRMPENEEPQRVEMTKTVRWKERGKSLEYQFDLLENGQPVTYRGIQTFDAVRSLFVYRAKWGENPETISHERYDPSTRTTSSYFFPTKPTSDNKTVTISRRVGDDKTQQTMEVFHKGRRVFSQELTSTRIKARQENVSP